MLPYHLGANDTELLARLQKVAADEASTPTERLLADTLRYVLGRTQNALINETWAANQLVKIAAQTGVTLDQIPSL